MLGASYTLNQFIKTNAIPNVPERISLTNIAFRKAIIIGNKAWRTPNVGNVYFGMSDEPSERPIKIIPGATFEIEAPEGQQFDFYDLFLAVVNGNDGIVVLYS